MVVVGGGIGGLTAAWLLGADPTLDVLLLEATPAVGGKVRRAEVAGVTVDVGAEAMLNRRPEGVELARGLGLPVVHPTSATSRVWTRGALRPLPRTLLGVPLDVDALERSGMLTPEGLAKVRAEPMMPPTEIIDDVSVATLVGHRLGDEVVDRLVEPLLGGVYAGHARLLSARATTPGLVALLEAGSLLEGAAAVPTSDAPVFAGIPGGMGELAQALAESGRFRIRTGATVRELRRTGHGFEMIVGSTRDAEKIRASSVLLATPAPATSKLLRELAPRAAAELATIEYASMAVVTLALPLSDVAGMDVSSGFLVPPLDGRRVKAATFSFAKWDWVREAGRDSGVVHLRTSLGRHGEEQALQATDEELVSRSLADLEKATGLRATPVETHVQRWGGGLPQYLVGHLDRVARIKSEVSCVPGLEVCGAAYDGVGIPAVIASARRAVEQVSVGD